MLPTAFRLRSMRIALGAAGALGVALLFLPLAGVHGIESALVLGLALPSFASAVGAAYVASVRKSRFHATGAQILRHVASQAIAVWLLPTGLLALNALRVRQCAPWEGLALMILGPGFGILLAGIVGMFLGGVIRSCWLPITAASGAPIAVLGLGVVRIWSTPAVFDFSHFAGYFPGTLYDEDVGLPLELVTFRITTVAIASGLSLLFVTGWCPGHGRLSGLRLASAPCLAVTGALLLAGGVLADAWGPELGHRSTVAHIAAELGSMEQGRRCIVFSPRELRREDRARLVADCDFRVEEVERRFGVRSRRPVTAFFFRSAEEKQRLMGAGSTYVAKPWRREVYLQADEWPHPVLEHEIVHAVAGQVAPGPFRVPGALGGWLPNPALIEGLAVAIAWNDRDGMTPDEGARALLELGRLPSITRIFGLAFWSEAHAQAYTTAGSFLHFIGARYGPAALRKAYATNDLALATGESLESLADEWLAYLRTVPLSSEVLALSRARFAAKSIFSSVCPRVVARLRNDLAADLTAGDAVRAARSCDDILAIDPSLAAVRGARAAALARSGKLEDAEAEIAALMRESSTPPPVTTAAREALGDALWAHHETRAALQAYSRLLAQPQTEDRRRTLEVKLLAVATRADFAEAVRQLLAPSDGVPPAPAVAVTLAQKIRDLRSDGLGPYLLARQLTRAGAYTDAAALLAEARARGLPTERLTREARRLLGRSLFAIGRIDQSREIWRAAASDAESTPASRAEADEWLLRIRLTTSPGDRTEDTGEN